MDKQFAFPLGNPEQGGYDGMELRDYFAAAALTTMPIRPDYNYSQGDFGRGQPAKDAQAIATAAYRVADAMMIAREKSNG